jgi:hypothetical protein
VESIEGYRIVDDHREVGSASGRHRRKGTGYCELELLGTGSALAPTIRRATRGRCGLASVGSPVCVMTTTELDELLIELGRQGFICHEMRLDHVGPDVVGFVRSWAGGVVDVVILFDEQKACAWRTASGPGVDVFAPDLVSWWYEQCPVWTLRAVLSMPPPGHPDEPCLLTELPPGCALPKAGRKDLRVRMRPRH